MTSMGLYTLAEIREKVWRRCDMYRGTVDAAGVESGTPVINGQLVSVQDLNMYINTALTARYIDAITEEETLFSDESVINVTTGRTEYELPEDMAVLRRLMWKWPWDSYLVVPPNKRYEMFMIEEDEPRMDYNEAPTYRRRLNFIVLNDPPKQDNPGGILVEYIKWILPLLDDGQVIETQFARILQEIVIYDAAIQVVSEKAKMDPAELRTSLQPLETKFMQMIRNSTMPSTMLLTIREHPIQARPGTAGRWW